MSSSLRFSTQIMLTNCMIFSYWKDRYSNPHQTRRPLYYFRTNWWGFQQTRRSAKAEDFERRRLCWKWVNHVLFLFHLILIVCVFKGVLKHHFTAHTICSSAIIGNATTHNVEGEILNMERTPDDELIFEGKAKIVKPDIVATNGVIHLIDQVIIPDSGKELWFLNVI